MGLNLSHIYLDIRPVQSYIRFIEVCFENLNQAVHGLVQRGSQSSGEKFHEKVREELKVASRKWDELHYADWERGKAETHDKNRRRLPLTYRFQ